MCQIETEIKFVLVEQKTEHEINGLLKEILADTAEISENVASVLCDTYYDTKDRQLSEQRWGLRVRKNGLNTLVALKGPAIVSSSGALVRPEFEGLLDPESLQALSKKLHSLGIEISLAVSDSLQIEDVLISEGLCIIQKRKTERLSYWLCDKTSGILVGELVMDKVIYEVGGNYVIHNEIEIECKNERMGKEFNNILDVLNERLPHDFCQWTMDKLALGFILEELAKEGLLVGILDSGEKLSRNAYNIIKMRL
ncbi:MAG: CYTH domain-containing protein [Desulfomonilaceae bacterium]